MSDDLNLDVAWVNSIASWIPKIDIFPTLDSTNSQAKRFVNEAVKLHGCSPQYLCLANEQTRGRGRLGRSWVSDPDLNIYASLVWQFSDPLEVKRPLEQDLNRLSGLSLVVGLSIVEGLSSCGLVHAKLKWPNDIVVGAKKIGGVLIEVLPSECENFIVIIGFGINVHMRDHSVPIDQPWTSCSIAMNNLNIKRSDILMSVVYQLKVDLANFVQFGWPYFISRWDKCDELSGQVVMVKEGDKVFQGKALGVDTRGGLIVELSESPERISFYSGEVSVRKQNSCNLK